MRVQLYDTHSLEFKLTSHPSQILRNDLSSSEQPYLLGLSVAWYGSLFNFVIQLDTDKNGSPPFRERTRSNYSCE